MTGTDPIDAKTFISYRLIKAHFAIASQTSALLTDQVGITTRQWWILAEMVATSPRTATDLADRASADKGLVSRNLKGLIDMGLIETQVDPDDRRARVLSLTEAGRRVHDEALVIMAARNDYLVGELAAEDVDLAIRVLRHIEHRAAARAPDIRL